MLKGNTKNNFISVCGQKCKFDEAASNDEKAVCRVRSISDPNGPEEVEMEDQYEDDHEEEEEEETGLAHIHNHEEDEIVPVGTWPYSIGAEAPQWYKPGRKNGKYVHIGKRKDRTKTVWVKFDTYFSDTEDFITVYDRRNNPGVASLRNN